ncbi:MAG: hypothetical protein IT210_23160, partial [Armatimonadetes bacterium]|nr:hypothetical protein [Armatimonadota bacterium]
MTYPRKRTVIKISAYLMCVAMLATYLPAPACATPTPPKLNIAVTTFTGDLGPQLT